MGKSSTQRISFYYLAKPFIFSERTRLKTFLLQKIKKNGRKIELINFIFCSDAYLLKLNHQYLNHNTYTDIITFEHSFLNMPLLADIYISVERVKQNAQQYNSSFKKELHRVIFHGILHLIGFNDKTSKQAKLMRFNEDTWLTQYFVSREIKGGKD